MNDSADDFQNSGDMDLPAVEMNDRINNYDHVESTVIKRDEKENAVDQWVEVIKIIRVNKRKPFIGGYKNVNNDLEYWNAFSQTDQKKTNHKLCYTR